MIDPRQFADWVSGEAKAMFVADALLASAPAELADLRLHYGAYNRRMLDDAVKAFAVEIAEREIAGVVAHVVTPAGGATDERVLICLHGGAFMWGSGAGALLEAVPVAAITGMEVIAVDYRLAPEHPYPAAVDDVLAVHADLLSRFEPSAIGLYGCSAGAMLTAQTVARMVVEGRPTPGAIAMLHGAGLDFAGDSAATSSAFALRANPGPAPSAAQLPYFAGADMDHPLVLPGNHPGILARFPPSLLVSGTRDFAASACSVMHRRLLSAGAEAGFVLFDGIWHAHHMAVGLPESRETFALLDRFFKKHLR
ncbi:alpha/beta hydrolase [Novosphingobium sp. Gsoil 351]|uniref:alpha/beta hydrolase n=1 Tax=Novosphingobium sp. Gsoil 351 TaxID=2675225 RepID=UPI0018A80376|nr:alpha/beta hydrolase fold domain-containing protein [Novosphingobium sp. Gsoil 351]